MFSFALFGFASNAEKRNFEIHINFETGGVLCKLLSHLLPPTFISAMEDTLDAILIYSKKSDSSLGKHNLIIPEKARH